MWAVGHLNISEITVKGDQHIVQALTLFSLSVYIYIWDTYMCSILPECHWKLDVAHTYKTRYLITSCGDYWTKITVITLSGDLHSTRVTGLGTLVMVFYYVTKTFHIYITYVIHLKIYNNNLSCHESCQHWSLTHDCLQSSVFYWRTIE